MNGERQYGWMWEQACDLLEQAERMQRTFLRYIGPSAGAAAWEPPVDIQEGRSGMLIVFALPGVVPEDIELRLEPYALTVRTVRRVKLAHPDVSIRRLEIPHGQFYRRIPLAGRMFSLSGSRYEHGCLEVHLVRSRENEL